MSKCSLQSCEMGSAGLTGNKYVWVVFGVIKL